MKSENRSIEHVLPWGGLFVTSGMGRRGGGRVEEGEYSADTVYASM
jgi:hypothetical protein